MGDPNKNPYFKRPTQEDIENKKKEYLEIRDIVTENLKSLINLINEGDEPVAGDKRNKLFDIFNKLDRNLIDKLDYKSFEYFEAKDLKDKF